MKCVVGICVPKESGARVCLVSWFSILLVDFFPIKQRRSKAQVKNQANESRYAFILLLLQAIAILGDGLCNEVSRY